MQHLGPVAIIVFWFSILYILQTWGYDLDKTLSDHVVQGKPRIAFLYVVAVTMTALIVHATVWLFAEVNVKPATYVVFAIAYVAKMVTALVPRVERNSVVHDVAASTLGILLFVTIANIAFGGDVSAFTRNVLTIAVVAMFLLGITVMKRERRYYLLLQGLYYALFSFAYVFVTYA